MTLSTFAHRRSLETMDIGQLERHQLARLNQLLAAILPHNRFYADKLRGLELPLTSLEGLQQIPYTFKEELLAGQQPGDYAANLTWPPQRYLRFHQTSGTRGRPLVVLDTAEDWQWWLEVWQFVFDAAGLRPEDRILMAFSFGPFIGFWSAFDAALARGCMCIPAGGAGSLQRLELLRISQATVLCCTPSYALHLAEVAGQHQIDVADLPVRTIIVAGEPGGSLPAVRDRINQAWQAEVIDHAGASEVGPWGYADAARGGLHVNESQFIAEFISVADGQPAAENDLAELVITSLGRVGCPILRYRTGDLVRPVWQHDQKCRFVLLPGGVLGRSDDMMIVRGVNVFPSAIEQILRSFPEVVEYRITVRRLAEMDELEIEVEDRLAQPQRIVDELQVRLGLRVAVRCVPIGSLPRFEGKGKRFVDLR